MLALQVSINGRLVCTAGVGDDGTLTGMVQLHEGGPPWKTGGAAAVVAGQSDEHFVTWLETRLAVGDEITFKVVHSDTCDLPQQAFRFKLPGSEAFPTGREARQKSIAEFYDRIFKTGGEDVPQDR